MVYAFDGEPGLCSYDKRALTVHCVEICSNPYHFVWKVIVIDASEGHGEIKYQTKAMIGGCFHGGVQGDELTF